MLNIRSRLKKLLIPMTLFLPFWLTFGRGLLGSAGWGSLIYLFFLAPILFFSLLIISITLKSRPQVKSTGMLSKQDAILLTLLYISIFLHGLFLVDGGDTTESLKSVATELLGRGFISISGWLSEVFYYASMIFLILTFIVAVVERSRDSSNSVRIK